MSAPEISREHALRILARGKPSPMRTIPHAHPERVSDCFRCDLSSDEQGSE